MRRFAVWVGVLSTAGLAALSGTVKLPAGSWLSGVTVKLAKTTSYGSAVTGSAGTWTLSAPTTGIRPGAANDAHSSSRMKLANGHLSLEYAGATVAGRQLKESSLAAQAVVPPMAARSTAVVDTLLFSRNGIVKARLPIGVLDSTGIVTVIDTASVVIDVGTTGTTWAASCPTTKTTCTSGTWATGVPDPSHVAANSEDPTNPTGPFVLRKESAHFAIFSDSAIADATLTSALSTLETTVWTNLFESNLFMREPYCNSAKKTKAAIHVHANWGLTGGGWVDNAGQNHLGMWIGPGALADHWGLTHEFTHTWQSQMTFEGGLDCVTKNTCGWIHESHANYTPHQLPEYQDEVHCSEMLANAPHVYLGSSRDRYCNWQFMEFLKDKYCPVAVNDIWTSAGDDPFTSIQKSRGWTVSQLNDFFGDWAMHNIVWDYQKSGPGFRAGYGNITDSTKSERIHRLTRLEAMDTTWTNGRRFVSPFYGAPQRLGYNVVRLYPEAGATTVTVTFRGVIQAAANSDFRWGLVATNAGLTTARYSALQRGTDGSLTFKVNTGEPLFLVVMGTPSVFQSITWDQEYNSIYRFPYMVQFTNAWPDGFQGGKRDACPTGLVHHSNGGGCVPSGTATSAYVGPYALVKSGSTVSGTARIEDQAVIWNGTVSGGTVGALSVLGTTGWPANTFKVSGTPTVRTIFYPLGFYEANQGASGTANVYGDVEYRGDGLNLSSGSYSGFVDNTSTSSTSTDVTVKGPYTWRP